MMNKSVSIRTAEHCRIIKEAGFYGVDYDFTNDCDRLSAEGFEAAISSEYARIDEAGLKVCQTHLSYLPSHFPPVGDGSYEAFEEVFLPILTKEIELTARMGCDVAVAHMYFEEDADATRRANVRLIEKLMPALERFGVTLAVENIYGNGASDAHFTTSGELMYYADYFDNGRVGVCLDTGHAAVLCQNPLEMLKELGTRVKAVHLHSAVPRYDIHNFPYVNGKGYWPGLFRLLAELGECKAYNFEIRPAVPLSEETVMAYYRFMSCLCDDIIRLNI